jgi:hypothetical protein
VLRGSGSHFCKFHFSENLRLFAEIQTELPCLNFSMKPRSLKSGSRRGRLFNSLAFKTALNLVAQVIVSTSSCPMVTGLLREIRVGQLSMTISSPLMHSTRSDRSPSTTMTALWASPSLIRMGHYSGRLDALLVHGLRRRQCCWQRTK